MNTMAVLALLLPFLGFLYCALIGWRMPIRTSGLIATAAVGLSFLCGLAVLAGLMGVAPESRFVLIPVASWIDSGNLHAGWGLWIDPLSTLMLCVVTGVGFLIHVYAT